ncbi:MAG: peptidoglycan-binding protein [Chitinophagales bacterium]|nr:peptidoglycan-binding protein [Chitinophagales bacterium]
MKLIRTFLLILLCVTFGQVAMAQQSNMQTSPKPKPKPVKMQPQNSSKPTKAAATTNTNTNAIKAETTPVTEATPAAAATPAPTSGKVSQIQEALRAKGYDPGPTDNVLGAKTRAALTQFQKDNNLPVGNLNVETMRALGVN